MRWPTPVHCSFSYHASSPGTGVVSNPFSRSTRRPPMAALPDSGSNSLDLTERYARMVWRRPRVSWWRRRKSRLGLFKDNSHRLRVATSRLHVTALLHVPKRRRLGRYSGRVEREGSYVGPFAARERVRDTGSCHDDGTPLECAESYKGRARKPSNFSSMNAALNNLSCRAKRTACSKNPRSSFRRSGVAPSVVLIMFSTQNSS